MASARPLEDLSARPGSAKEQMAAQLEPATQFLVQADISSVRFPHFTTLKFLLEIGLHHFAGPGGLKQANLGDLPCEGGADRLDEILCGIARKLPGRKIEFGWSDVTDPGDDEEGGATGTSLAVVGGDKYLAKLFPKLAENGMVKIAGVSGHLFG